VMFEIKVLILISILILSINYFLNKRKFLVDKKYLDHKSFVSNNLSPISGGIIFLISILIFSSFENLYIKILFMFIFIIGLLSDLNYLVSPIKRILFQILVVVLFIYLNDIYVQSIRIHIIDQLLENLFFKIVFTSFCFLVLLNGSNFIDGLNTILIGYYFLLSIICILLIVKFDLPDNDYHNFSVIMLTLSMLFIFNFFGKLYSGDGGAYLISFIIGIFLINLANLSEQISPYFVACLLWYPAYENLFSIFRKKIFKRSVINPDNRHLHHLIFLYLKKKNKFNELYTNTISGMSINIFNLIIFYNAYQNISQTKNLIYLIIISIIIYNFTYWKLNKIF
jgi:UDP-N-acetylmuramyl pentapeptide phosphotransferase/UDP-N-acetylglucosamine-1-phosphate transferase